MNNQLATKQVSSVDNLTPWEYIKQVADHYIYMYPLIKGTKKSAIKDWPNRATYDIEQLKEWLKPDENGNISCDVAMIPFKSELITIDVDNHHGNNNGSKWITENIKKGNRLNENSVAMEITRNNGFHYIYRNDLPYESIPKKINLNDFVEVKTTSTIIFPSDNYRPANETENIKPLVSDEIGIMPDWLRSQVISAIEKDNAKHKHTNKNNNVNVNAKAVDWLIELNDNLLNGISSGDRNNKLTSIAGKLFATGASNDQVWNWMQLINDKYTFPSLSKNELKSIFNSISKSNHNLIKATSLDEQAEVNRSKVPLKYNKSGSPRTNFASNFAVICEYDDKLRQSIKYDEFINSVVIKHANEWKRWSDLDETKIRIYIENQYNVVANNPKTMYQGIEEYAVKHSFNPVKDIINEQQWDNVKRVETLFIDYLGADDNSYNRMVARKFMVGAVSRIFHPGIKFDLMVILTGKQGLGKSTLLSKLSHGYFLDNLGRMDSSNKDETMKLQDSWIVELGELAPLKNSKIDNIKSFISATSDMYRKPFGQANSVYKRNNVFAGTTNEQQFLSDKTGNRRYLTVECGVSKIKHSAMSIDDNTLHQIYAEAKYLMEQGELLYLTSDEEASANAERSKNESYDPVDESIKSYINMLVPKNWDEYSEFQREQHYKRVFYENRYSTGKEDEPNLTEDDLVSMKEVSTRELLSIPLNKDNNKSIQGTSRALSKKISLTMSGLDDWKQSNTVKSLVKGKYARGYKRV
ncbi:VapE domain-containing protein [Nicoliella lavandulae]|uniref:VapE family protein n=1 Tax=Nicoliella lavandulae TaxID=3082954 RepID=A0ABU8SJ98_9LACO